MGQIVDVGQEIGGRIRQLRVARGLSQAQLAEKAAVHVKLLARIETGRRSNVTVRTLERLARGLDTALHELLRMDGHESASPEVSAVVALLRGADKATKAAAVTVVRSVVELGRRKRTP